MLALDRELDELDCTLTRPQFPSPSWSANVRPVRLNPASRKGGAIADATSASRRAVPGPLEEEEILGPSTGQDLPTCCGESGTPIEPRPAFRRDRPSRRSATGLPTRT